MAHVEPLTDPVVEQEKNSLKVLPSLPKIQRKTFPYFMRVRNPTNMVTELIDSSACNCKAAHSELSCSCNSLGSPCKYVATINCFLDKGDQSYWFPSLLWGCGIAHTPAPVGLKEATVVRIMPASLGAKALAPSLSQRIEKVCLRNWRLIRCIDSGHHTRFPRFLPCSFFFLT